MSFLAGLIIMLVICFKMWESNMEEMVALFNFFLGQIGTRTHILKQMLGWFFPGMILANFGTI